MTEVNLIIIDYGLSNILSVERAFAFYGIKAKVSSDYHDVLNADGIVLPGVGAFEDGMKKLADLNMIPAIKERTEEETPLLGICLGMQMLFDDSEEFGIHEGLGLIEGHVKLIPEKDLNGISQRRPHIGWNVLYHDENQNGFFTDPLLKGLQIGEECYFVHSYEAIPEKEEHLLAFTKYGGRNICAVVRNKNVFGTQFHPEKSGKTGLEIIKNFIDIVEDTALNKEVV